MTMLIASVTEQGNRKRGWERYRGEIEKEG